ncbi:MAG: NUMOD3 motif (2 copies) [Candidatus Diapherotrites archaeon ADurb.Bin253]|jgi:very-short-patch-repair endonuclease|nr:MAG: NUMOD3 motif (2 copies) [Candidatus Diapherotrites archaeon ADurb.Bin253]
MSLCFWCGVESKFKLKSGKFCCCETPNKCIGFRKKNSLSHKGNIHSQETRSKISLSNKGRIVTVETKEKIKESMKRKKETGWINHPESTKIKMSEKLKGRKISNETTKKRLESRKGYRHTEETKEKIRVSNKKRVTEEFREKQRKRMLNGGTAIVHKAKKNPSKQESKLREIINRLDYKSEFTYQILNYFIDIAIPEYKIAIEYDGYYHFDTEEHIRYHKKRQEQIEEKGWKFLRYNMYDKFPTIEEVCSDIEKIRRAF